MTKKITPKKKKTTAHKDQIERNKVARAKRRKQGLCIQCGTKTKLGRNPKTGKFYSYCQRCINRRSQRRQEKEDEKEEIRNINEKKRYEHLSEDEKRFHTDLIDKSLCLQCGVKIEQKAKPRTNESFVYCEECLERKQGVRDRNVQSTQKRPIEWEPRTLTGFHYKVKRNNRIGIIVPCILDDMVILEFYNKTRDVYRWRDIEYVIAPLSRKRDKIREVHPNGKEGIILAATIEKMIQIHEYLLQQPEAIKISDLKKALGFDPRRLLTYIKSQQQVKNLESEGIVERIPTTKTTFKWQLTKKGKEQGREIIESWLD